MKTPWRAVALVTVLVACARMGAPPGGPPDANAPKLLGTFPESVAVLPDFKGWVEFRFDEVVDESGAGGQPNFGLGDGGLERLILLSPDTLVPRVDWKRNRIMVRPKHGWLPNTVYRIELTAGMRDLRGNQDKSGVSVTFATGGEKPTHYLSGRAIDWLARRGAAGALIELTHLPENTLFRSTADSAGRFRVGPLPSGAYLVEAVLDVNHDHRRGRTESWDSVRVPREADSVGEIWAFPRDTMPPKATKTERIDTMGVAITFAFPVDPALRVPPDSISLWVLVGTRPDSQLIVTSGGFPQLVYDSLWKQAPPKPDTGAAAGRGQPPPPVTPAPARRPSPSEDAPTEARPPLGSRLIVRSRVGLRPTFKYAIEVRGVRMVGGATGTVTGVLPIAPVPNVDSIAKAKAKTDSIRKADSIAKAAGGRGRGGGGLREFRFP